MPSVSIPRGTSGVRRNCLEFKCVILSKSHGMGDAGVGSIFFGHDGVLGIAGPRLSRNAIGEAPEGGFGYG